MSEFVFIPLHDQDGNEISEQEAIDRYFNDPSNIIGEYNTPEEMDASGFKPYEGDMPWATYLSDKLANAVSPIETGIQGHPDVVKKVPNPFEEQVQPYINGLAKLGFRGSIFNGQGQTLQIDPDIAQTAMDTKDILSLGAAGVVSKLGSFGIRNFNKILTDKIATGIKNVDGSIAVYLSKLESKLPDIMPEAQKAALKEGFDLIEQTPVRNADFAMHEMHRTLKDAGLSDPELDSIYDGLQKTLSREAADLRFSEYLSALPDDQKSLLNDINLRSKKIENVITEIDNRIDSLTTRFKDVFNKPWAEMTDEDKKIFNRFTKLKYDQVQLRAAAKSSAEQVVAPDNPYDVVEQSLKQEEDSFGNLLDEYGIRRVFPNDNQE